MKKRLAGIMVMSLIIGVLGGCAGTPVVYYTECNCNLENVQHVNTESSQAAVQETVLTEGALKTGLSITTSVANSENGVAADYDITQVAVLVDDAGVIQDCIIDGIAAKVNFDNNGKITDDVNKEVLTKNELGADYGMVAWGGAIAEWDAQAAAFAAYVTGKNAEEIGGISIDEKTVPTEADLSTSVTISIGGFQELLHKALQ